MTLTELHDLAVSIQLVLIGGKPQGYAEIADALRVNSQPLPPHTLRVLDVLCDVGHVERISPSHDSPRRYRYGKAPEDTRTLEARLRTVFADDLADAKAEPGEAPSAAPPAVAAPTHNAAPAQALPPPPKAAERTPVNLASLTPVTRGKPAEYQPGNTARDRVLALVTDARQCSRAFIGARLYDIGVSTLANAITELVKAGQLHRIAPGEYSVDAAAPRKAKAARPTVKDSLTAQAAAPFTPLADMQPPFQGPIVGFGSTPRRPAGLIDAAPPPALLPDRAMVIATLRRLSPMLAPDLSRVLDTAVHYLAAHTPEAA